jgi:phosphate transport system substrate-binding protein
MQKIKFLAVIVCIVTLFACSNNKTNMESDSKSKDSKEELKGTISISGAFALYPMTARWAEEFRKIHPNVRIDISAGGAGKGMTDALSGIVDLGMFSREISDVEKAKGVWWIAATKDAVLPTINANSPVLDLVKKRGITREEFIKLFITKEITTWGELLANKTMDDQKINIFTRSDACGAAQMWGQYLGKNQESLMGIGIFGDPGMADVVKNDLYGIGYNNVIYIYDIATRLKHQNLEVIPIDLNEDGAIDKDELFYDSLDDIMEAIKDGKYPSPPARELYFVAKGKPENKAVIKFLKWVITEGQVYVKEGGYVQLPEEKLAAELSKLSE